MRYFLVPTDQATEDMYANTESGIETALRSPDGQTTPFKFSGVYFPSEWEVTETLYTETLNAWFA